MRIGIIGAGQMAHALGSRWAKAGHEVCVGARSAARAAELTERARGVVRAGSVRQAAEFGDVVLLAVPATATDDVLEQAGGADGLSGKTLIDCTNAFSPDSFASTAPAGFLLSREAVAEHVARLAPRARVVKAFNLCAADVWEAEAHVFDGRRLMVPLCGDNRDAMAAVATLACDLGLEPVNAGGLDRARYLEATAAFVVGLWFAGHDARAMFPPLQDAAATADA